jgi:hypothetical protein
MNWTLNKFFLNKNGITAFLSGIEGDSDSTAISLYLPPGLSVSEIEAFYTESLVESFPPELLQITADSASGAAVFLGDKQKCLILPPFPLKHKIVFPGYTTEPLREIIGSEVKIGIALVHLGSYAVGFCQGDRLVTSKVGTGLVHGRHKKGGSSQQRFQRRRQNQAREFLERVCTHVQEHLGSHLKDLDYIIFGGPHQTILSLKKLCPLLQSFEDRTLPLIDVPSPNQRILETTVNRIWSSYIIEWQEEELKPVFRNRN